MTERGVSRPVHSGRRERRKSATRAELILAGRRLFSEKGLYEARIEDLTAMAGIAKGTLYTYFPDKDELIRAVASAGFAELEGMVAQRVRGARSEEDLLRRVVRGHLQFFGGNPDMMRVFHQVRGMLKFDRAGWRPLRVTLNAYLEWLARALSSTPRAAAMRGPDRLELARVLFGAISGVTSVTAASGRAAARSAAGRPLVKSLVALAKEYVSARESHPHPKRDTRSRAGRLDPPHNQGHVRIRKNEDPPPAAPPTRRRSTVSVGVCHARSLAPAHDRL